MKLADLFLHATLGRTRAPDTLQIGLFLGGRELDDVTYRRADVTKGAWDIKNHTAEFPARFGPFVKGVSFDRAVLMRGGEVLDEQRFEAPMQVVPQTVYTHIYVVDLVKA